MSALRSALSPIMQTALAAGVAWELARHAAGHTRPVFAVIVVVVSMGITPGRRARAAVFIVLGVSLGIAISTLLVRGFGVGGWQIALAVALAAAAAAAFRPEPLLVSQAAVSSMLVVALPAASLPRLIDCVIGGGVAIVASAILFPIDAHAAVRAEALRVLGAIEHALAETAAALEAGDSERAWAARALVEATQPLDDAVAVARDTVRIAPLRFRDRRSVERCGAAAPHLAAAGRTTRVLSGAAARALRRRGPLEDLSPPLTSLAASAADVAAALGGSNEAEVYRRVHDRTANARGLADALPDGGDRASAAMAHLVEAIGERLEAAINLTPPTPARGAGR